MSVSLPTRGPVRLEGVRGLVCDVDGVVHAGDRVFDAAVESLNAWMDGGLRVVFLTNNASRGPEELAERLQQDGVRMTPDQVITGAMAGSHVLVRTVDPGTRVLVAGSAALARAVRDQGLEVTSDPIEAGAVVQGYAPTVTLQLLHDAAHAVSRGATWVATNRDAGLPTAWGVAPGNGAYVDAVARATGREPLVAGKPEAGSYTLALERLGLTAGEVTGIGDRLETDVLGANRAGLRSVLVGTGVHGWPEVEQAAGGGASEKVPDHVVDDLSQLTFG